MLKLLLCANTSAKFYILITKYIFVNNFFLHLGACEGTLSCSTCHIILKKEDFDRLPDKPSDEEMDMLDLAFGLCDT